jgi:hypothetical protein
VAFASSLSFATAIHAPVPFAVLGEHLDRVVADWRFRLAGGVIRGAEDGGELGEYELLPPDAYADRSWHRAIHPCPFVSPLAGYLHWQTWAGARACEAHDVPLALLREGCGVTARVEEGRTVEAVTLQRLDLYGVLQKWGLDDGAALLTRDDGPYQAHVLEAIRRALAGAGLEADLSWLGTSHNPVRLSWYERSSSRFFLPALWGARIVPALWDVRGKRRRLASMDALSGVTVEIWAYELTHLRDESFWDL